MEHAADGKASARSCLNHLMEILGRSALGLGSFTEGVCGWVVGATWLGMTVLGALAETVAKAETFAKAKT